MLENWQRKATMLSEMEEFDTVEVNFLDHKEEIQNAFFEICKPLEGLYHIELDKEKTSITICGKTYTLNIKEDTISIIYESHYEQKFIIFKDNNGVKKYRYAHRVTLDEEMYLSQYTLNYKSILNTLMNNAFQNIR